MVYPQLVHVRFSYWYYTVPRLQLRYIYLAKRPILNEIHYIFNLVRLKYTSSVNTKFMCKPRSWAWVNFFFQIHCIHKDYGKRGAV